MLSNRDSTLSLSLCRVMQVLCSVDANQNRDRSLMKRFNMTLRYRTDEMQQQQQRRRRQQKKIKETDWNSRDIPPKILGRNRIDGWLDPRILSLPELRGDHGIIEHPRRESETEGASRFYGNLSIDRIAKLGPSYLSRSRSLVCTDRELARREHTKYPCLGEDSKDGTKASPVEIARSVGPIKYSSKEEDKMVNSRAWKNGFG